MQNVELYLPNSHLTLRGIQNFEDGNPEIIAFHGWLDNCNSFVPMLAHLSDLKVLAIDFPGHGYSDHYPDGQVPYFHDLVYTIAEILETMDIESCTIMGHSMGGAAASLFAGSFPERVQSLILLDSLGPITTAEPDAPAKMKQAISTWLRHGKRANPIYEDLKSASSTRQKSGNLNYEHALLLSKRGTKEVDNGVIWANDPKMKLPSPALFSEAQVAAYLQSIEAPTLLVLGKSSFLAKTSIIKDRSEYLRQHQSLWLDGGHHIHMEQSSQCAKAVREFLMN